MKTAAEMKIKYLYHYQGFDLEWLDQTLNKNVIYLSNPGGFNDPWDCKPCFNVDINNQKLVQETSEYFGAAHKRKYPDGGRTDVAAKIEHLKQNPSLLKKFVSNFSDGLAGDIDKQYRIYCLTTKACNALMWGHYTNKHTGICLEFNTNNEVFSSALQIEYGDTYPPFSLTDDGVETNVRALTTKSNDWAYEEEYRLIALEKSSGLEGYDMLMSENNFLPIPENSLESVITGCMISEDKSAKIQELIDKSGKSVKLKRAVKLSDKYGLSVEDY